MSHSPAPARGWRRPVQRRHLLLVSALVFLTWAGLMVTAFLFVRSQWMANVVLNEQDILLRLPEGMAAQADLHSPLMTHVRARPPLVLPVDQPVRVEVLEGLSAQVVLQTEVPVQTQVEVSAEVPVDTEVALEVPIVSWLPRLSVRLPVRTTVPVRMSVPVSTVVPLVLDLSLRGKLQEAFTVPVQALIKTRATVDAPVQVDMVKRMSFAFQSPLEPFPVTIEQAHLHIPMRNFGWTVISP